MSNQSLSSILFVDLECVPEHSSFFDLDEKMQELWEKKWKRLTQQAWIEDDARMDELYENRSWIYAEFGKIIVISIWWFHKQEDGTHIFRLKSFYWDDEKKLLEDFFELLNSHYYKPHHKLCGHNIKEFDVPYICRRALVHWLRLPTIIDSKGKKPWEINHLDTMDMRRFGERRSYCSLDLLCRVLWVQTPKTDISWEQVARVYCDEKDLPRIKDYCERDVVAVGEVLLKFMYSDIKIDSVEFS